MDRRRRILTNRPSAPSLISVQRAAAELVRRTSHIPASVRRQYRNAELTDRGFQPSAYRDSCRGGEVD